MPPYRGIRCLSLGNHMRKLTLVAAAMLAAAIALPSTSNAAAKKADPAVAAQQNTSNFIANAMNPGMAKDAAAKPAKKKMAKKSKKKAKK